MSKKLCKDCTYGPMEAVHMNGSPPKYIQACDFIPHKRQYPKQSCVYWKEKVDPADLPGRGDSGNLL